jgi:hypothetical protein
MRAIATRFVLTLLITAPLALGLTRPAVAGTGTTVLGVFPPSAVLEAGAKVRT